MVKLLEFLDRHTARHLFRSSHLKEGIEEENNIWNTTRLLTPTQERPRLSGDCLGIHLLILTLNSNFKITLNLHHFLFP